MKHYKVLKKQSYFFGNYSIVPLRREDRFEIMNWRNEQLYHLRQERLLTKADQNIYFDEVVSKSFNQDFPSNILFSYLEGDKCIGYGGLVHIDYNNKNSEISFIMETSLEEQSFEFHWSIFLNLIERIGFDEMNLQRLFTYAFDLRPRLYPVLLKNGYFKEARLKNHRYIEQKFVDVIINAKTQRKELRRATVLDSSKTFDWANSAIIRKFSYNKDEISINDHLKWFTSKLNSEDCIYYLLEVNGRAAGSIRFDIENSKKAKISYLIDPFFGGKGLGTYILEKGINNLKAIYSEIESCYGEVLKSNIASVQIFKKLNFSIIKETELEIRFEKKIQ